MRTITLLTTIVMLTGCQYVQRRAQECRFDCPTPACNPRSAGNCCEQKTRNRGNCCKPKVTQPRCDLTNACRSVRNSCQKLCESRRDLQCKRLGLGWKEFRVPVPQLKDPQPACGRSSQCNTRRSCKSTASCGSTARRSTPTSGCYQEFPVSPNETTPFLTLPPQEQALNAQPRWRTSPRQPSRQPTADLAQRTQVLESQVTEIHSMLRQQQNAALQPASPWRTMDGVPPIPGSQIEQTGAFGSTSGTYRTAYDPQMWPHSPQNMQRAMIR